MIKYLEDAEIILNSNKRPSILVVGDVMLDQYWFGNCTRISPEAPVPVLKIDNIENRPGGAANVAYNAQSLGAKVTLIGIVGGDDAAGLLSDALKNNGINCELVIDNNFVTTKKLRAIGHQQQLLRIDLESSPTTSARLSVLDKFSDCIDAADIIILSDYGKGALFHVEEMIKICMTHNKKVFIDPKGSNYIKYQNATLLTPNRHEFKQVAGAWLNEADFIDKAHQMRKDLSIEHLLITRSEDGMMLFSEHEHVHDWACAKEVFDVSGAGDTVIATLAVMASCGVPISSAVKIANSAAGVVVSKVGTASVQINEIKDSLQTNS